MKRITSLIFVLVVLIVETWSQSLSFGFADSDLEAKLNVLNFNAKEDMARFCFDVSAQWGVKDTEVSVALSKGLEPAEVYVAAFLSKNSGETLDTVVMRYTKNKKAGWGALAKSLGIKPGSQAFKTLKKKVDMSSKEKGVKKQKKSKN